MAQASRGEQAEEVNGSSIERGDEEEGEDAAEGSAGFKLNVHAPEFVPRSQSQAVPPPLSGCFYPCLPFFENGCGGAALGPGWFYFAEQEPIHFIPDFHAKVAAGHSKGSNDVIQKIVKQVEYQFSDTNLVANDFLMKIMNKDPQGFGEYRDDDATDGRFGRQINPAKPLIHTLSSSLLVPVPMSVVASWKKIKSLGANHHMLIKALRTSTKLALSEDGKKVRRKQLFTERDKEELQSRTVVVENLPEDYSRQNLGKLFSVVGSVKNIRICHPQEPSSARSSKGDVLISNKTEDNQSGSRKGRGRGRAKSHGLLLQSHSGSGLLPHSPQSGGALGRGEASSKQTRQGPRMPDGTRGFAVGRGKPPSPVLGRAPSPAAAGHESLHP
ncbi:hypothetical protein MUK42_10992 [Musa troglodytarum]|uniref:La-related protein 6C n=1 Tax=Musa troglodytarum TaxID=320322 RepID=A0A9E7KJ42_9LILI|nr:hypothetical protein MUK42_10992 [Musa troglodytarum]